MRWSATLILTIIAVLLALNGWKAREAADAQRRALEVQTEYLCAAVAAVDNVVIAVLPTSQGAIRQKLFATHVILSQTQPCQEVAG